MNTTDYSKLLSDFCAELKYEDIPESTIEYTKLLIIDYFAAAIAGCRINKVFNNAVEKTVFDMGGKPESQVLYHNIKLPAPLAALVNGVYSHGADMDDGHKASLGHPACATMPAVMALAETLPVSGKDVLKAIVIGYEFMVRLSAAVMPAHLRKRGFHSSATAGTVGATMACASLMKLDHEKTYYALGLGCTQASGLMLLSESGQSMKPLNPGKAAFSGILAARILAAGPVVGAQHPLESEKGFFRAFGEEINYDALTDGLGSDFRIAGSYMKPYPSCRHTHAGVEAMTALHSQIDNLDEIECINEYTYPTAISVAGRPENHYPTSADGAKFSIAYTACCALVNGTFGLDDLERASCCDKRITELSSKFHMIPDESKEDIAKGIRGCTVEIIMKDGRRYTKDVVVPKGDAETPMSLDDMRAKLAACAGDRLTAERQEQIISEILALDKCESFAGFMDMFAVG